MPWPQKKFNWLNGDTIYDLLFIWKKNILQLLLPEVMLRSRSPSFYRGTQWWWLSTWQVKGVVGLVRHKRKVPGGTCWWTTWNMLHNQMAWFKDVQRLKTQRKWIGKSTSSYHSLSNYYYVISLQGVSMTTWCVKLTITFWHRMGCGEPVYGSTPSSTRCCKISALAKTIRVVNTLHASIPWPSDGQECMPHKTCQNIQC